jgi:diacylglycerol O-acyltransferase / wax synthase
VKNQAPFKLSPIDENYLHMASANQPMHVCLLLELSAHGDPLTLNALRARIRERAFRFDIFQSVIRHGTMRKPKVQIAEGWDPATNVTETTVHDHRGLRQWVAQHMDVPLTDTTPRWRVTLVHVSEPARQFIVVSIDHCLADAVAAPGFLALLLDSEGPGLDQPRFLTAERFPQPKVPLSAARSALSALGRSWYQGRTPGRWPSIASTSRRAVDTFSIPTQVLRDLTRATHTSTTEYLLAVLGQALSNLRADYAPEAHSARILLSVTLDPSFRHTGNAEGLALVNVPLGVADLDARIRSSQDEVNNVAQCRPELALPALSPGQKILPWALRRAISKGVFGLIRPDVALSITPAFLRSRTILGKDVMRVFPVAPLTVFSVVVATYTVGDDVTFGITSDDAALPDGGRRLAAELQQLFYDHDSRVATKAMIGP